MPYSLEEELFGYCQKMERIFFWLTTRSIKRMAFDLAIKIGLARPLSKQQGRAGWKWLRNFMCCHPRLRLRKPQVASAARVKGFTKIKAAIFFDIFELVLWLINFSSSHLFNYEETGLNVFQHKVCKVISIRVSEGSLCLQQSGFTRDSCYLHDITVTYVPPLLVFPRSNMKAELLDSPPPVSITAEWIQKESFTPRFKHFVRFVKPPIKISLS